jgi:hypothetical protein
LPQFETSEQAGDSRYSQCDRDSDLNARIGMAVWFAHDYSGSGFLDEQAREKPVGVLGRGINAIPKTSNHRTGWEPSRLEGNHRQESRFD